MSKKSGEPFERDERFEAMLCEREATPKAFEWRHSLAEKKQADAYAEAKTKAARPVKQHETRA